MSEKDQVEIDESNIKNFYEQDLKAMELAAKGLEEEESNLTTIKINSKQDIKKTWSPKRRREQAERMRLLNKKKVKL